MSRIPALYIALLVGCLAAPSVAHAQGGEPFLRALVDFINASPGASGDEGPLLTQALDAMDAGLAEWDARIAGVEQGFASEIDGALPPVAARMRTALGAAYLDQGRIDAALAQFDIGAALDPQLGEVYRLRGAAFAAANRPADAAAAYRIAWQRRPDDGAAAYLLLRSVAAPTDAAEVEAAMKALSAAVAAAPPTAVAAPRFTTLNLLDESSVSSPAFVGAPYAPAVGLLVQKNYRDGVARLRAIATADPLVADRALQSDEARRTAAALRTGNATAAMAAADDAVRTHPTSSEVQRLAGMAMWAGGRHAESLTRFRAAVRLNPLDERSRLALADVHFASGDPAAAREALGETIRVIPESGLAYWKLGLLHRTLGDEPGALQALTKAASIPSLGGLPQLIAEIGRLHHNRLDLDAAAAAYARRVRIAPNDSSAHLDLGDIFRAQEKLTDALAEYLVAALLDPASARAFAMIGLVHASAGRHSEALPMLRRAVALDPAHVQARYGLSRALLRLGLVEESERELEAVRQLQAKAMEEERRRFQENQAKIDAVLGTPKQ